MLTKNASKKESLDQPSAMNASSSEAEKTTKQVRRSLPERPVSKLLQSFIRKLSTSTQKQWSLKVFDCGGGGDCLFHTIREGLNVLREEYREKYDALFTEHGAMINTETGLRRLAARKLVTEGHEEFLNKVLDFKDNEKTEEWYDKWSPLFELHTNNFGFLSESTVTRVNAVEYGTDKICIDRENLSGGPKNVETYIVKDLSTHVADLRQSIEQKLSKPGNYHWGTYADIVCLSDALNIGFIVLRNETHGGVNSLRGWIYSLGMSRSDFSHWMLLYCKSSYHFQLAALSHDDRNDQAVFTIEELPEALRKVYDFNCPHARIGQGYSSGFS